MTRKVVSPIALDKSINTTEQTPRNIADVLAQQLAAIKTAIESGNGNLEAAFVCYYGVTTATQIKDAIEDGKVPYFYYNGAVAQLWKVETDKYTFRTTNTRSVEGQTILDVVDYVVNGSVWSTITREVSGGSSSGQSYIASVNSLADFDTTGHSGMHSVLSVNNVPADGIYQLSVMLHITPKTANATKSDLVFHFTSGDGTGWPNHTFHAVVDDSQTFAQQLSFSTSVSLKAGQNTLRIQCGGLNTEYLVFVDELTIAQLVNGVYHNGDDFDDVHTLTEALNFNNDDGILVDGATGGPRFMTNSSLMRCVLDSLTLKALQTEDNGHFSKGVTDWLRLGTINQNTGEEMSATNRVRSGLIRAVKGDVLVYQKNKVFLYVYSTNQLFLEFAELSKNSYKFVVNDDCYIRFVLAYQDDSEITNEDLPELINNFKVVYNTEKPVLDMPDCPKYDVYEPSSAPDIFKTTLSWTTCTCPIGYNELIANYFDVFVAKTKDYVVNKKSLGLDASGKFPLYEFDFIPKNYSRVVLLSAGMNGVETSTIFGVAEFLRNLFESNDPGLVWLRENVRLKVIPVINPYSFEMCSPGYGATGVAKYVNANGVNINRNFNYNGQWELISPSVLGEWSYKGEKPESEPETQILIRWVQENSRYAACWMDCHSDVTGSGTDTFRVYTSDAYTRSRILSAQEDIKNFYIEQGLTPSNPSASIVENGLVYPKHPYFYKYMGVRSFMMEQYFNIGTGYGATGYNCDSASIKNYVVCIRAYILAMLEYENINFETENLYNLLRSFLFKNVGQISTSSKIIFENYGIDGSGNLYVDGTKALSCYISTGINGYVRVAVKTGYLIDAIAEYDKDFILSNYRNVGGNPATSFTTTSKYIRIAIRKASNENLDVNEITSENIVIAIDYVDSRHTYEYGRFTNVSTTTATIDRVYNRCLSASVPLTKDLKRVRVKRNNGSFVPVDFVGYNNSGTTGGARDNSYDSDTDSWVVAFAEGTTYFRFSIKLSDNSNGNINLFDLKNSFLILPV